MKMWERNSSTRRTDSQSTLHQHVQSFVDKLLFWKNQTRPPDIRYRVVVPNPMTWEEADASASTSVADQVSTSVTSPNRGYAGNCIRTTKYTLLSFLPKNLFEQFHRFANLYFLFIVLLNWVPQINAFGKEIAMIPVVFVLCVTAIKDLFEDRRRYRSDKRINSSTCRVYQREAGRYTKTTWSEVLVGDIVHLSCNEIIPADILLLHSSDEQGLCYIETANLDGESNLKQRQVVRGFHGKLNTFHPTQFRSTVECDLPNNKIYRFHGFITHPNGEKVPIDKENLLLRDCIVKNTDYVEGIVVYAGHETKAMLNNGGPRYKRSRLERRMNWDVVCCVIILFVLCFVGATGNGLWLSSFNSSEEVPFIPYRDANGLNPAYEGFLAFWTHVIILQVLIPLSLYVSVELIKLGQVYFIHNDIDLYDSDSNKKIECRALNIPEELGQVQYIFSDKTGTLTENNMIFRRCTIGGVDYNHHYPSISDWSEIHNQNDNLPSESPEKPKNDGQLLLNTRLQRELTQMDMQLIVDANPDHVHLSTHDQRIQDFFLLMAVCNTVVVSKYPHQDKMNSSGLYLDASNTSSISSNHVPLDTGQYVPFGGRGRGRGGPNRKGKGLLKPIASTVAQQARRSRLLQLPLQPGRSGSPAPSPSSELKPIYEAESPDELALVNACYQYNSRLLKRMPDSVTLSLPGEGMIEFQTLHTLPFDPVRKRMSVILLHPITKQKVMYIKGADSSMFTQLAPPKSEEEKEFIIKTQQHLNNYAKKGLRILVMAKKVISDEEYLRWLRIHKEAEIALEEREQRLLESACYIETNLVLLGATGIEDRLQDGVPECIASLRQAGIVVWVLTGDKQETAVNIAYSCHLFTNDMDVIYLNARSKEAAEATIKFHLDEIEKERATRPSTPSSVTSAFLGTPEMVESQKRGLVIDGRTLAFVLERSIDCTFLALAQQCSAVLCCRATPLQKASIVKLVKDQLHVLTLAIGDGANDVSMIQTADVGIGISGQEGMQAVMASDFAIARFRYLEKLLLVQGHWCYDRLARTILYFFYKNAGLIFIIFWYQLYCGFSGMVVIEQLNVMLYNLMFTSFPPLIIGIFDQDVPADLLILNPQLYRQGRHSQVYRNHSFWVNILDALYQSLVIFFFVVCTYHDSNVGIWEVGTTITFACLIVQLFHLFIETKSWTYIHLVSFIVSIGTFFIFNIFYDTICLRCSSLPNPYWVFHHCLATPSFWLIVLIISIIAPLPRLVLRVLQYTLCPSDVTRVLLEQKRASKVSSRSSECEREEYGVSWSRANETNSSSSVFKLSNNTNSHFQQTNQKPRGQQMSRNNHVNA
ncbi:hypothetical protein CHUAL_004143 [Chamberlinius hualienensis]